MRIAEAGLAALTAAWVAQLSYGQLALYEGLAGSEGSVLLVVIPIDQNFRYRLPTEAVYGPFPPAPILATGEAQTGQLFSVTGELLGDFTVGTRTDRPQPDAILDRTDCEIGGTITVDSLTLRLPLQS